MILLRFQIILPKARIYSIDHHSHIRPLHLRVELNLDAIFCQSFYRREIFHFIIYLNKCQNVMKINLRVVKNFIKMKDK